MRIDLSFYKGATCSPYHWSEAIPCIFVNWSEVSDDGTKVVQPLPSYIIRKNLNDKQMRDLVIKAIEWMQCNDNDKHSES